MNFHTYLVRSVHGSCLLSSLLPTWFLLLFNHPTHHFLLFLYTHSLKILTILYLKLQSRRTKWLHGFEQSPLPSGKLARCSTISPETRTPSNNLVHTNLELFCFCFDTIPYRLLQTWRSGFGVKPRH